MHSCIDGEGSRQILVISPNAVFSIPTVDCSNGWILIIIIPQVGHSIDPSNVSYSLKSFVHIYGGWFLHFAW